MSPGLAYWQTINGRFPRVSGDEPCLPPQELAATTFSPRER